MSDNAKQTTRIYTGPAMIANGLIARLNDIGISPVQRDDHQSGITSGFAQGVPGQVQLFIRNEEKEAGQATIDAYLKEIGD
jgi:hypothetical protein